MHQKTWTRKLEVMETGDASGVKIIQTANEVLNHYLLRDRQNQPEKQTLGICVRDI
jgi:hypothetical protein